MESEESLSDTDEAINAGEPFSSKTDFCTVPDVKYSDVAEYVEIDDDCDLKFAFGPCRVGTKAQLFTMAASGYPAYDQPLKAIYRCLCRDEDPEPVQFPSGTVYFKETIGPYTEEESRFDPVKILRGLRSDEWLREHLRTVLMIRDPVDTWQSWYEQWERRVIRDRLLRNFVTSFRTVNRLGQTLRELEVPLHVFDYSDNKAPETSYRDLFSFLGLSNEPVYQGWDREEVQRRIEKNWRTFNEPDLFLPPGIREEVKDSEGVFHKTYSNHDLDACETVKTKTLDLYENWVP